MKFFQKYFKPKKDIQWIKAYDSRMDKVFFLNKDQVTHLQFSHYNFFMREYVFHYGSYYVKISDTDNQELLKYIDTKSLR